MNLWEVIYNLNSTNWQGLVSSRELFETLDKTEAEKAILQDIKSKEKPSPIAYIGNGVCDSLTYDMEHKGIRLINVFLYKRCNNDPLCSCGSSVGYIFMPDGLKLNNPEICTFIPTDEDVIDKIGRDPAIIQKVLHNTCSIAIEPEVDADYHLLGLTQDYEIFCPKCNKWHKIYIENNKIRFF